MRRNLKTIATHLFPNIKSTFSCVLPTHHLRTYIHLKAEIMKIRWINLFYFVSREHHTILAKPKVQ